MTISKVNLATTRLPGYLDIEDITREYHAFVQQYNLPVIHPVPEGHAKGLEKYNVPDLYMEILVTPEEASGKRIKTGRRSGGRNKTRKAAIATPSTDTAPQPSVSAKSPSGSATISQSGSATGIPSTILMTTPPSSSSIPEPNSAAIPLPNFAPIAPSNTATMYQLDSAMGISQSSFPMVPSSSYATMPQSSSAASTSESTAQQNHTAATWNPAPQAPEAVDDLQLLLNGADSFDAADLQDPTGVEFSLGQEFTEGELDQLLAELA